MLDRTPCLAPERTDVRPSLPERTVPAPDDAVPPRLEREDRILPLQPGRDGYPESTRKGEDSYVICSCITVPPRLERESGRIRRVPGRERTAMSQEGENTAGNTDSNTPF